MTCSNESTLVQAAQLLLTAVMLPEFLIYHQTIQQILVMDLDPDSSIAWSRAFHRTFLSNPYSLLLLEFLGDPTRSKELYVDGNKFEALATTFAKPLFGPSVLGVYSNTASQDSERGLTKDEFLACAFSCLPDCLLRASPSMDLAFLLQSHQIPSSLQDKLFYGCSSEATVAAIKSYILRCNISEVSVEQQQSRTEHENNCGCCHVM
ncbi:hypothetical protein BYT27DRAFT_6776449 [Phlegmacium glaucopus]|nr:hypothetical protein BYT27DRAFT_6776449 [Phlegmacium glaucopus]